MIPHAMIRSSPNPSMKDFLDLSPALDNIIKPVVLVGATLAALGYSVVSSSHFLQLYAMIAFTAIAMGMRNAAVRKLAVPDLTTTMLTLTITGIAADSSLARGTNPRLQRRIAAVVAMFAGAALGSITLRHSVFMALAFSVVLSSLCSLALLISSRLPCARNAEQGLKVVP
jgi:uncharacterized membrane protein YoaK (UPF0700 family)